jgi:hypothetical protein
MLSLEDALGKSIEPSQLNLDAGESEKAVV